MKYKIKVRSVRNKPRLAQWLRDRWSIPLPDAFAKAEPGLVLVDSESDYMINHIKHLSDNQLEDMRQNLCAHIGRELPAGVIELEVSIEMSPKEKQILDDERRRRAEIRDALEWLEKQPQDVQNKVKILQCYSGPSADGQIVGEDHFGGWL